jgi:hypothetical protein
MMIIIKFELPKPTNMKYFNAPLLLLLLVAACTPDDKETVTPSPKPDIFDNCSGQYNSTVRLLNEYINTSSTTQQIVTVSVVSKYDSLIKILDDTFRLRSDSSYYLFASQTYSIGEIQNRFHPDSIQLLIADRLKSPHRSLKISGRKQ